MPPSPLCKIGQFNATGRLVGIYPELKNPDWHRSLGYPMEELFLALLATLVDLEGIQPE